MAENKTQPTEADVGVFADEVEPARRRAEALRLDAIFQEANGVSTGDVGADDGGLWPLSLCL